MKILIVYASAGAGHRKAAEAIYEGLSETADKKDIALVDSLDFANPFFRWLYAKQYVWVVNYLPFIWGFFYYLFDNPFIYRLLWLPRRITNSVNCRRFEDFLLKNKPALVIATHFMAPEIISRLKQKLLLQPKLFSVVTDYRLHSFWLAGGVDCYFAATESTKNDLIKRGIPPENIYITGLPISLKFSKYLDSSVIKEKLGIEKSLFTVLIIGGGFGVGPVELLVRSIGRLSGKIQLLVVCGQNQDLYKRAGKAVSDLGINAKVWGFVNNVDELMSASDVLVTKAGGLTTAEALAKNLPIVFIKPIPGQETRNSRVLEEYGAAFVAKDVSDAARQVKRLLDSPSVLSKARQAAGAVARQDSVKDIIKYVYRCCR